MPLNKSEGNMYPWVTHTHSHLGGHCPHDCAYCYVKRGRARNTLRYKGPLRLIDKELTVAYGEGKTIFIEHCNDLFAADVPPGIVKRVIRHCGLWPGNQYVFQTKNPAGYTMPLLCKWTPKRSLFGITLESNRDHRDVSRAPAPLARIQTLQGLVKDYQIPVFVSIEPILDLDIDTMVAWLLGLYDNLKFVTIGADSKGCKLPEPKPETVRELILALQNNGIEVRSKDNLSRLLGK